jgi:CheY-like chemotaxis protein
MSSGDRRRVLIVDDEEPICRLVDRILVEGGYDTVIAPNADAAIGLVATDDPLDLLLTDLMMPDMNGDELARRIRQVRPSLKVLYLTGFPDKLFSTRPTLWEGEAFLEKPIKSAALREAVSLALFGHARGPA